MALTEEYRRRPEGWSAKHFYAWYRRDGGRRSYTWVKSRRQDAERVPKAKARGVHRKRRNRSPWPGLKIHQDGSTHEWVPGQKWDLIVTMDNATNEHYSMFFVAEEGTASSLQGVREVIESRDLFSIFYSDRGSHYGYTPEAGGRVDKQNLTPFGRALQRLGIGMIAAYSPETRGRSERMFRTHQEGSAFVGWIGGPLDDILAERFERTVGDDNGVSFEGVKLQIPADRHRCHYVKAKVNVLHRIDGSLAIFHGPRKLADDDPDGQWRSPELKAVA